MENLKENYKSFVNEGKLDEAMTDVLQEISTDFSALIKKHVDSLKKLKAADRKALEMAMAEFKNTLDDLS